MNATDSTGTPGAPSPALVKALKRVCRPLVRLMLAHGITYPYLCELLKGVFVEVAERDFQIGDKPPTDSRVSLVSGVHRKDVSRLRGLLQASAPMESSVVPLGAQVLARWMGDPRYLQEDGQPRPLARFASEAGELSFEALVSGVNSDIRSRVLLDEWLRLGLVELDAVSGQLALNAGAFQPPQGLQEKAFYLGHNLHDHTAAAVHNVLGLGPPLMERSVHHEGLSPASVQMLAELSEQWGMKALLAVNKAAMKAQAQDRADPGFAEPGQRFTLGVYFYRDAARPAREGDVA